MNDLILSLPPRSQSPRLRTSLLRRSRFAMRLLAVVSYFAFFCSGTAVARQGYTNPVRDSNGDMVRVADPFVYRHGGVYYLIGTTRQHNGFDCYTSPDLVHWTFAGAAYTKPDGHYGTGSFWAPEVKYYNGKFYLTYSAYNPANRKLLSSSVQRPVCSVVRFRLQRDRLPPVRRSRQGAYALPFFQPQHVDSRLRFG